MRDAAAGRVLLLAWCAYADGVTHEIGGLAATGSDVTTWLIVAGIVVLLGVIALVVAGAVRSRRGSRSVEEGAGAEGDDSPSATRDGGPDAPASRDPAVIAPSEEFAPNVGPLGQDIDAPADPTWPADGEAYQPDGSADEAEDGPGSQEPSDRPPADDDPGR